MKLFVLILITSLRFLQINSSASSQTFNVLDYGAVGDGNTEDTQAFLDAWKAACKSSNSKTSPIMLVPGGKSFLLQPFTLDGHDCKSTKTNIISIVIDGELIAPKDRWAWKYEGKECRQWILLKHMKGLVVKGSGSINAQGNSWWDLCTNEEKVCTRRPTSLILEDSDKVHIKNLAFKDSPQMHMAIESSKYVYIKNLYIEAPGDSPNTDGIHIQRSKKVSISRSSIRTGDDCISIGDGSYRINISKIACGPGHGISIGSLGKHGDHETVEFVHVKDVTFTDTTNGFRIKTWQTSAVKISNVSYNRISGTSRSKIAVNLVCSETKPCRNILMKDIKLESIIQDEEEKEDITSSLCENVVDGHKIGSVIPNVPCLKKMN
ncbi:probable polygalacturonase At1g80170 [Cucumis melo]|uniref:Probable polygalacturonase At1g80170 n=1 Tax=Cucumis melo TaxID=3656 RepID=A0ABM3L7K0_CUCME|nr:probable polygalacturonase At1g80170 [Cucumis melo]